MSERHFLVVGHVDEHDQRSAFSSAPAQDKQETKEREKHMYKGGLAVTLLNGIAANLLFTLMRPQISGQRNEVEIQVSPRNSECVAGSGVSCGAVSRTSGP